MPLEREGLRAGRRVLTLLWDSAGRFATFPKRACHLIVGRTHRLLSLAMLPWVLSTVLAATPDRRNLIAKHRPGERVLPIEPREPEGVVLTAQEIIHRGSP